MGACLTIFIILFRLLFKPFGLDLDPNDVNQVWHSMFNTFIGPVLSLSVTYFFHYLLYLAKIGRRRAYNTQAYRKLGKKLKERRKNELSLSWDRKVVVSD